MLTQIRSNVMQCMLEYGDLNSNDAMNMFYKTDIIVKELIMDRNNITKHGFIQYYKDKLLNSTSHALTVRLYELLTIARNNPSSNKINNIEILVGVASRQKRLTPIHINIIKDIMLNLKIAKIRMKKCLTK